jgi:hypothetical protein
LEGKVLSGLKKVAKSAGSDGPSNNYARNTCSQGWDCELAALSSAGVDSASALRQHWAETDRKFLFQIVIQSWTKAEHTIKVKQVWMDLVKRNIHLWKTENA